MRIEKLIIPTPFPVGPINIYLVMDDPLTLIDTGPKTPEALEALRTQLRAFGVELKDIRRVILTHTHEDHCGLAATIQHEANADVFVHEWERTNLTERNFTRVNRGLLKQAGVPDESLTHMAERYALVHSFADVVLRVTSYVDHHEFTFASGALRVVHTPGHTPGSCCLWRESNRLLIAGDTILKNITPNPVLNADPFDGARRFAALGEYVVSLARVRELAPTLIYTAHGGEVTEYDEYFFSLIKHIETRQQKVVGLIPQDGTTAWQMSQQLFPHVKDLNRFLAVSETIAHLDWGVMEGRLRSERRAGVDWFHPASH
ncbi:MAG: MBL fold metallo-hydrolase [Acidobacteria bacterium]|nr:MBL fold metallo-hydrolase [Acidobacteriota bacterium]